MKAFLRYAAVNTRRPEVLADHYKNTYQMREMARSDGNISLTDGWFKLSVLGSWPDNEVEGVRRFGFAIDDLDELRRRLAKDGKSDALIKGRDGDHHGEYLLKDPLGMYWDLSDRNFGLSDKPEKEFGVPRMRHAEVSVADTHRHMEWVISLLGIKEINTSKKLREAGSPFPLRQLGDGQMNITFLPFDLVPGPKMSEQEKAAKWACNHYGFVLPSLAETFGRIPIELRTLWTPAGNMAECQVHDPDGNVLDLSETAGYEVAFDRWERGSGPGGPPAHLRAPDPS